MRNCSAEVVQRVLLVVDEVRDGRLGCVRQRLLLLHVLWDEYGERLYFGIVVRVDAHLVLLQVVRVLAVLHRLQLVLALQVGPTPQPAVDHVRHTLSGRQSTSVLAVQRAVSNGRITKNSSVLVNIHFLVTVGSSS